MDLLAELEKLHECMAGVKDDRAVVAELLSQSIRGISDALVDQNMPSIQSIPPQPQSAKDVLAAFSLVLERLWEEHASGFGSQA
jgi:hypothetical protein